MPIYEFYCPNCHTLFNFYSWKVDTETTPPCPQCKQERMRREVSLFAVTGRAKETKPGEGQGEMPFDEAKMEKAMQTLEREAAGMDENDPKQAARMMKRLSEMSGMELNGKMKEALQRLEAGEDPDKIEAEMGDAMGEEDPFIMPGKKGKAAKKMPPKKDKTLYEM